MTTTTNDRTAVAAAIRAALEAELGAARFYRQLEGRAEGSATRAFLGEMIVAEESHARAVEELGQRLEAGVLPVGVDWRADLLESAPEWANAEEITLREALEVALECELRAGLYYGALKDGSPPGALREFFARMEAAEEEHAKQLEARLSDQR
jgi:rubrerythrin